MEILGQIEAWHWFVLSAGLFMLEVFATTGFFIGIAVAALLLSAITYFIPELGMAFGLTLFGALSVALTLGYKKYFKSVNEATDSPLLNDRAAQMVGTTIELKQDIEGKGALMIHDTRWQVECDGLLAAGTRVSITGSRGMTLILSA